MIVERAGQHFLNSAAPLTKVSPAGFANLYGLVILVLL